MADFDRDMKKAIRKLEGLGTRLGRRTLNRALSKTVTPTIKKMRAKAPKSRAPHKTYRGLTVTPGFLSRSIRRRVNNRRRPGVVSAIRIGVERQAFYGPEFLDRGITVSRRRRKGLPAKSIRPYTLRGHKFFQQVFSDDSAQMLRRATTILSKDLRKL